MDDNLIIHILLLLSNLVFFLVVLGIRSDWREDRMTARQERWEMQQTLIRVIGILENIETNGAKDV